MMMIWTYPLLVALLLRIVAAQSNPYTDVPDGIIIGEPFTFTWDPTTDGTVTLTLIAINSDGVYFRDLLVLAGNIPNSGSFTGSLGGTPPSTSCSVKIVSDDNPTLVTYSAVFNITEAASDTGETTTITEAAISTTFETGLVTTTADTLPITAPQPKPTTSQSTFITSITSDAATADTTSPSPSPSLPSPSSTAPSSPKVLSAGAAAGIGVGATLGALILLAIGGFFWWRARKRSFGPGTEISAPAGAVEKSAEESEELKSRKRASELEGSGKLPAELQGTPRAELSG